MKTPAHLGYHLPAEWEQHDAIWLSWPHDPLTFENMPETEKAMADIVSAIHTSEQVNLLVKDEVMKKKVTALLAKKKVDFSKIVMHVHDYADVWFRDYGPIFVINRNAQEKTKKLAMTHWIFNAWGNKYEELLKDAAIPEWINKTMKIERFAPGIVLEGGSIDGNGKGTLLTTEQCLLNKNRNPHLSKQQIEQYLKDFLGVKKIIWLKKGIAGDDTDGHVDDLARFVNPTTVLCAVEDDAADENYPMLKENYEILKKATDQDGKLLTVITLPMPDRVGDEKGRVPASYANFYIGNTVVLVPVFGHKNDEKALKIIQEQFPQRKVVGINCYHVVFGFGTIHCMSQQQPMA